jgi:signal transduction histidine kinase
MNKPNLLVIDDDILARETFAALLVDSGYELAYASSGLEGIEKASTLHPEVILLDVMMPGMDGYEVCRRLRANPQLAEVPIIMVTAMDDRDSRLVGLDAGADDFLAKPIDSLELEIRLRTLKRVSRYRHLLNGREKLDDAYQQIEEQNAELKLLSEGVLNALETEHRHLAMELHDEIGQLLTGLKMLLENQKEADQADRLKFLDQALEITDELLHRVRELSLDLRPTVLDDFGLLAALDWLFQRFQHQTTMRIHHNINPLDERRFPKAIETASFRLIQESLTNIVRHAGVEEATVTMRIEPEMLHITVIDSGTGFDPQQLPVGHSAGISGMRERVRLAGGQFSIQSMPGDGTLITAEFPL